MERSSENLSTTLEHSDDEEGEGGGSNDNKTSKTKERKSLAPKRRQAGQTVAQTSPQTDEQLGEHPPEKHLPEKHLKEKESESPKESIGVFRSLRGKASSLRGKASSLRTSVRKSVGDSKATKKNRFKIVEGGKSDDNKSDGNKSDDNKSDSNPEKIAEGDYLVHPAHGVGYVRGVEAEEISGARMDMIAISFEQERMVVRVPTCEYENCGLRSVSSPEAMEGIYDTLKTKRRIRKTMWGRRAQEYDNKIRSGDPVRLAQVVRELYRGEEQPSPSYSERQYYQLALERLSREVAVVEKIEEHLAVEKLETILAAA